MANTEDLGGGYYREEGTSGGGKFYGSLEAAKQAQSGGGFADGAAGGLMLLLIPLMILIFIITNGLTMLIYLGPGAAVFIGLKILVNRVLRIQNKFLRFLFFMARWITLIVSVTTCINVILHGPLPARFTKGPIVSDKTYWLGYQEALESGTLKGESWEMGNHKKRAAAGLAEAEDNTEVQLRDKKGVSIPVGEVVDILSFTQGYRKTYYIDIYKIRRADGTVGTIPGTALSYATQPPYVSTYERLFGGNEYKVTPVDPDLRAAILRYYNNNGLKPEFAARLKPVNLEAPAKWITTEDLLNKRGFDDVEADPERKMVLREILKTEEAVFITFEGLFELFDSKPSVTLRNLETGETYIPLFDHAKNLTPNEEDWEKRIYFGTFLFPPLPDGAYAATHRDPKVKPRNFLAAAALKTVRKVVKPVAAPSDDTHTAWEIPEVVIK